METLENGSRPKGGIKDIGEGIPSVGGEHLNSDGRFDFKNLKLVSKDFYSSLKRGKIKRHDVLVVKDGATTGKTSFVRNDFPFKESAVNEHVFILRGRKEVIEQKFLFYHLRSPTGQKQIDANFHGAAIGGINTQFAKNYFLRLPPIDLQRKIVSILEKAEQLRQWRKESDKLTTDYLNSVFLKMFGDPLDTSDWETRELRDIVFDNHSICCGPFGSSVKKNDYVESGFAVLGLDNVENDEFIGSNLKFINEEKFNQLKVFEVKPYDVLMTRRATVGRTCVFSGEIKKAIIGPNLFKVTLNESIILPAFLVNVLIFPSMAKKIRSKSLGATFPSLTTSNLKKLQIIVPPLKLQTEFVSIKEKIKSMSKMQERSASQTTRLFNALMSKAFKGELIA